MSALETYAFSADISQLMSLIINAFYSNKEIFLRELISNASDATDKIQHKSRENPECIATQPNFYINITPDTETRTVTVEDAGIGMSRDELINHLGTIAQSGTKAFMEAVQAGVDMTMIGQFGVGFYSAYLVSERIRVVSKSNDDDQYVWESSADGTFKVWKDTAFEHGVMKRGTKVICYLKDDQAEFLESSRLKSLILKHSAFVAYPISLYVEQCSEAAVLDSQEQSVTVTHKWELVNKTKPLWLRPPEEVTHAEYAELYKFLTQDYDDHLGVKHVTNSGQIEFKVVLYCPRKVPRDLFDMGKMAARYSIQLYVRRVFIKEFDDMIPKWMSFIKGIVDSDDMPLNISREKLQQNVILKHMKAGLMKYAFELLEDLSKDVEKYKVFYEAFSQCLKLGVYEDNQNRQRIVPLLRYQSSRSEGELVSFDDYVSRMKPGQSHILIILGPKTVREASRSPYIGAPKREGYEVLYMVDPVDEYSMQFLKEYKGNQFLNCMNMDVLAIMHVGLSEEDRKSEFEPMRREMQALLSAEYSVRHVSVSDNVPTGQCARLARDGGVVDLELNLKHGLLREVLKRGRQESDFSDIAQIIYAIAMANCAQVAVTLQARLPAVELCQTLITRLSPSEMECTTDDLPIFSLDSELSNGVAQTAVALKRTRTDALISCGNAVRVVKQAKSRRATITYVDEDAGTVDVTYDAFGGEEDEEGVLVVNVCPLLDFELDEVAKVDEPDRFRKNLYKTATTAKEEGNQLFKLKDFEAAKERYTAVIRAFASTPRTTGQPVLMVRKEGGRPALCVEIIGSIDAEGECELVSGEVVKKFVTLPVFDELLQLQTAAYMNRSRCQKNLGLLKEASQDLSVCIGLWGAANKRMLEANPELKEAQAKGQYTAQYLRAQHRLARGLVKQASADVRDASRNAPSSGVGALKQLKTRVQTALEDHKRLNGPLVKELTKIVAELQKTAISA